MLSEKEFAEIFSPVIKHFNKELTQEEIIIYYKSLKDFKKTDFEYAINTILKTFVPTHACPFPVIAHFTKYRRELVI